MNPNPNPNPKRVPKNIEGSPRTKTSYGAAATQVDEGVGFIHVKEQLTANPPTQFSSGAIPTNPSPETDVTSLDLEPLQFRANFPSPQENNNDGDPKSKTQYKAGNSKIVLGTRSGVDNTIEEVHEKIESSDAGRFTIPLPKVPQAPTISVDNHAGSHPA